MKNIPVEILKAHNNAIIIRLLDSDRAVTLSRRIFNRRVESGAYNVVNIELLSTLI